MGHLVRALAAADADGYYIHAHGWGQIIRAGSDVMRTCKA